LSGAYAGVSGEWYERQSVVVVVDRSIDFVWQLVRLERIPLVLSTNSYICM